MLAHNNTLKIVFITSFIILCLPLLYWTLWLIWSWSISGLRLCLLDCWFWMFLNNFSSPLPENKILKSKRYVLYIIKTVIEQCWFYIFLYNWLPYPSIYPFQMVLWDDPERTCPWRNFIFSHLPLSETCFEFNLGVTTLISEKLSALDINKKATFTNNYSRHTLMFVFFSFLRFSSILNCELKPRVAIEALNLIFILKCASWLVICVLQKKG